MAGIAGLLVKRNNEDADFLLQRMSNAIRHRSPSTFHTVNRETSQCLIVGPHAIDGEDGELFIIDKNTDIEFSDESVDVTSITEIFGAVVVIIDDRGISLLRTLDGTRPLYYGNTGNLFAFGSERKSLWAIGMSSVKTVVPGQAVTVSWSGEISLEIFATLDKPVMTTETRGDILEVLAKSLHASFERLRRGTKCAVLFSGGVDSSLAALLASKRCKDTILVATMTDQSHDKVVASEAAKKLGLPLYTVDLSSKLVWEILPQLIRTIETSKQMDVEIALPFYLAAKKAAEKGYTTIISGQGPDELFAGYARHVKVYVDKGPKTLATQLWNDVKITYEANIERDERAITAHGTDSFFPYLDQLFANTSLSIPTEWKVNPENIPERKVIFRELAQRLGVPQEIALAPKNATQYSSGSAKMILAAMMENVDELTHLSKKKASTKIQGTLDRIATDVRLLNREESSSSNPR
ncbi:MAG: asparagine synthase family protein [Candidatus Thorarchaeota archaeon]